MPSCARRWTLAEVAVVGLLLAVPLSASPWFWDQFTTVKWYALESLGAAWLLVELWSFRSWGLPDVVRARWPARIGAAMSAVMLLGSLRAGFAWAAPALTDRLSFAILVLTWFWYFRRNEGWTPPVFLASCASAALVVSFGLAQTLGWQPLSYLTAGDQRSAFFGNVNIAAQFLGFAIVVVLAEPPPRARSLVLARELLVSASFVYLYFLSCRSVLLGLGAALLVLLLARSLTPPALFRMVAVATATVILLLHLAPVLGIRLLHLRTPEVMAEKALSVQMRLALWEGTLDLIRDHPLGVGAGNFGDAFIPYQQGRDLIAGPSVLFRAPHNEVLRLLAEEGLVFGMLAILLLSLMLREARRSGSACLRARFGRPLLSAGLAFAAVEAFFQFPFSTAFGSLMISMLLGLALARQEPSSPEIAAPPTGENGARRRWRILGTLAVAGGVCIVGREVASELLFVRHRNDVGAQEAACELNPRNLPACVTAAWLRARMGSPDRARALLLRTLERSPYYHPAIRLLGELAAARGDRAEACFYFSSYDGLFRGRSALHARAAAACGDSR